MEVGVVDLSEAEQLGGVGQREEVVDLDAEGLGQLGEVVAPTPGAEDLEEPGEAADRGLGERHVAGDAVARSWPWGAPASASAGWPVMMA